MKKSALLIIVCLGTACGGKPISFYSLTPQPAGDAYTCALRKINELGYTVGNTNRDAGFIVADKQTSGALTKFLLATEKHDQLTVSVFDDAATQQRKIRITAGSTEAHSNLFSTQTSATSPSDEAVADANSILQACGDGSVVRQSSLLTTTFTGVAEDN